MPAEPGERAPRQLDGTGLKRLHREWRHRTETKVALLLDGVANPINLGSILRSAAAYRADQVWLAGETADPASAGAAKTALGSGRYLTFHRLPTGEAAVATARAAGYEVVGLELAEGASPLHEVPVGAAVCLAIGHEDHGLSAGTRRACDRLAYLPLVGRIGSLNVAMATSIALYELRRQEWARPG